MAWVSVYRSYAKYVLCIKTLTLPTQENGWLSVPHTKLCNYHYQIAPLPTPLLRAWSIHPLLGQFLGYPAVPTKTATPAPTFWDIALAGAGRSPAPSENLVATFQRNQTDIYFIYSYAIYVAFSVFSSREDQFVFFSDFSVSWGARGRELSWKMILFRIFRFLGVKKSWVN